MLGAVWRGKEVDQEVKQEVMKEEGEGKVGWCLCVWMRGVVGERRSIRYYNTTLPHSSIRQVCEGVSR